MDQNFGSTITVQPSIVHHLLMLMLFISLGNVQPVFSQVATTQPFTAPPVVNAPNRRLGQMLGKETILECYVTAYPLPIVMWLKDGFGIASSPPKYSVETYEDVPNQLIVTLRITDLQKEDYGEYICMAQNKLGSAKVSILLYEYIMKTTTTQTSTSTRKTISISVNTVRNATETSRSPAQGSSNCPQTSENVDTGHHGEEENYNSSTRHSAIWSTTLLFSILTFFKP